MKIFKILEKFTFRLYNSNIQSPIRKDRTNKGIKMKKRIISALLVIGMLFSLTACKKSKEEIPDKDKILIVETEDPEYSNEAKDELAAKMTDISVRFMPIMGSPSVIEEKKKEREEFIKNEAFSVFEKIPVYQDEIYTLVECAEESLALYDEGDANREAIADIYKRFNAVLGAERLGLLVYECLVLRIDKAVKLAQRDYDNYGGFYIEDVEKYTDVLNRAKALGGDRFAGAFTALMFIATSAFAAVDDTGTGIKVELADTFVILRKQGEKFADIDLGESEWHTVGEMFSRFNLANNMAGNFEDKMPIALDSDGFIPDALSVMPYIIDFYALLTKDISKENIDILEGDDALAKECVICSEIIKNEQAFAELLSILDEKFPSPGSDSLATVNLYKREEYSAFCAQYHADANELLGAIKAFELAPTVENYDLLGEALIGYSASLNSVVTYAYIYI